MQNYEDYLEDAFHQVSGWSLPPEEFENAVNNQARLMSGEPWDLLPELPCPDSQIPLQF